MHLNDYFFAPQVFFVNTRPEVLVNEQIICHYLYVESTLLGMTV